MLGAVIMTGLCAAGVAFNAWFLVALFREPRTKRVAYRVRMRLDPGGATAQAPSVAGHQATFVSKLA
jgi:hypothetical protein